jgi:hypothetical protein
MIYRGVAKGKMIEFEEPLPYPEGQPLRVSVEPLTTPLRVGSPEAILHVMREAPHVRGEDVDALEQAIAEGKLSVRQEGDHDVALNA